MNYKWCWLSLLRLGCRLAESKKWQESKNAFALADEYAKKVKNGQRRNEHSG